MEKVVLLFVTILLLCTGNVFATDSTGTPSGTAKQPDINQRGSNIIEVGNLETSSIDSDSVTVSGTMKSGSVDTGSISADSVNSSGTVSAGTLSAPSGAITNLNTNRTYVQRDPTSPVDGTNKKYVDDKFNALNARIAAVENDTGGDIGVPPSYTRTYNGGYREYANCPSGYTLFSGNTVTRLVSNYSGTYYQRAAVCIRNTFVASKGVITMVPRGERDPNDMR